MKFFLSLLLPVLASAAILPDTIGPYQRGAVSQPALADRSVWDEYGLKDCESVVYENGKAKLTAMAWQFQDTTGSMAAFDWQRAGQIDAVQSGVAGDGDCEQPDPGAWKLPDQLHGI